MSERPELWPLPDAEMPDREWTDLEWLRNQLWMGNEEVESLRARLRAVEQERDEAREVAADWRNEARGSLVLSHPSRAAKEMLPWEPQP
jgi:hypothetical protein